MTKEEAKEYLDNYRKMYADLAPERFLEALDIMLNEPSLPSNLDEAAEEYGYINWQSEDYHEGASEGLPFDAIGHTANCFKAGARWTAGQGVIVDAIVRKIADRAWVAPLDEKWFQDEIYGRFKAGDKVVVQIRKK